MSDDELLYLVRCGNEWAFEELYDICMRITWKAIRDLLSNKSYLLDIDEIVSDSRAYFMNIIGQYRGDRNARFRTYFKKCIKHRIFSSLKNQYENINVSAISLEEKVFEEKKLVDYLENPQAQIPDKILVIEETVVKFGEMAEKTLTKREKEVYQYIEMGYKPEDIAGILNISLKSYYNTVYRINQKKHNINKRLTKQMKCDKFK